jgi:hypothetical protein
MKKRGISHQLHQDLINHALVTLVHPLSLGNTFVRPMHCDFCPLNPISWYPSDGVIKLIVPGKKGQTGAA